LQNRPSGLLQAACLTESVAQPEKSPLIAIAPKLRPVYAPAEPFLHGQDPSATLVAKFCCGAQGNFSSSGVVG
jgi:hypothetical protein